MVRDTHSSPARAVITELSRRGESVFRATEFHVIAASAPLVGDFPSVTEALNAIRSHVGSQFREARTTETLE